MWNNEYEGQLPSKQRSPKLYIALTCPLSAAAL